MIKFRGCFKKIFANYKVATLIGSLDKIFFKLPHLPKKFRLLINKIVPFLSLTVGLLNIILSSLAGFFFILNIISWNFSMILNDGLNLVLILMSALFYLKAFKPLKNNDAVGWIYLFWTQILEITNLVMRTINQENNLLLSLAIILFNFYLLFEIGQFYVYKKSSKVSQD